MNNQITTQTNSIQQLKKDIKNTKHFTHFINDQFLQRIFDLKERNIDNEKKYKILSHLQEFIEYQEKKLNTFKNSLLSLISTIFLPLGFVVGFFGMNFKSMGNPGISKGILSINHSERFIFFLAVITIISVMLIFNYLFNVKIF
jgi:Mg2+ and Co2+ transporter CorA